MCIRDRGSSNWYEGIRINRSDNATQFGTFSNNSGATFIGAADSAGGNNNAIIFGNSTNGTTFTERARIEADGKVGIGTTSPENNLHIFTNSGDEGLTIKATGDTSNAIISDANRSGAGAAINQLVGKWNGTAVTDIRFITGSDTTNKDNGQIKFYTATAGTNLERMVIDDEGNVGIGADSPSGKLDVRIGTCSQGAGLNIERSNTQAFEFFANSSANALYSEGNHGYFGTSTNHNLVYVTGGTERMRIDSSGNLLVNTTNNSMSLKVCVNGSFGSVTSGNGNRNFIVNTVSNENWNVAGTVVYCGKNGTTGRSINAGGTVNASGADYAEYMKKADSCGTIAKGDVCGVDSTGKLTDVFNNAISFVIKSTNPSYVGGDTWGEVDLGLTEEQTETERQKYDRIAFSGQVPVNITGSFNAGDYVYPQANGTDIECVAKSSPTFEEYQICVGKIWAIEDDGRPLVAVKIG